MEKISGKEYLNNEMRLFGPIKNRIYSILGKGPEISDLFNEISYRRARVQDLLQK